MYEATRNGFKTRGQCPPGPPQGFYVDDTDKLKELQQNLAKDLVQLEQNKSVTENQLDDITEVYSKVYDIVSKIKSL